VNKVLKIRGYDNRTAGIIHVKDIWRVERLGTNTLHFYLQTGETLSIQVPDIESALDSIAKVMRFP